MLKLRWMPSNRRFEFDLSIFIFFVSLFLCFFDNFGNLLGADQEQVVPGQKRVRHGSDCIEHSTWKRSRSAALQRLQGIVWQTPGATMERFHWHHQTQRNSTLSRLSFRLMIADWWSILLMGDGRTEGGGGRGEWKRIFSGFEYSQVRVSDGWMMIVAMWPVVGVQVVEDMRRIYQHIDDVDLFIGGMSETRIEDGLLGPTFLCLIGDQMARLRRGDRFFYEEETAGFTPGKLFPLADVKCSNWTVLADANQLPRCRLCGSISI